MLEYLPTTVPTPSVEWSTKRAINEVNISGEEAPAAMNVAPVMGRQETLISQVYILEKMNRNESSSMLM